MMDSSSLRDDLIRELAISRVANNPIRYHHAAYGDMTPEYQQHVRDEVEKDIPVIVEMMAEWLSLLPYPHLGVLIERRWRYEMQGSHPSPSRDEEGETASEGGVGEKVPRFVTIGRCQTCQHWEADEHPGNPDATIRFCGILSCSRGEDALMDCNKQPVYTHPSFGCVEWEKKS